MSNPFQPEAEIVRRLYGMADHPGALQTLCNEAGDVLMATISVLYWMDERARNSRSFGSHADAYEIAARRLREAIVGTALTVAGSEAAPPDASPTESRSQNP